MSARALDFSDDPSKTRTDCCILYGLIIPSRGRRSTSVVSLVELDVDSAIERLIKAGGQTDLEDICLKNDEILQICSKARATTLSLSFIVPPR